MTVHPLRPLKSPKPPKTETIVIDRGGGGIEIRVEKPPAEVRTFPNPKGRADNS